MSIDEAVRELIKFAGRYGREPIAGQTTAKGLGYEFQAKLRVEFSVARVPIQAWIRTADEQQSCAFHFRLGKNRISFGDAPFKGDRSRVEVFDLPL